MANYILRNDEVILRCANWAMDVLYENLLAIAHKENFLHNSVVMSFISLLDQDTYGRGCIYVNIADVFKDNKNDLSIFVKILTNVIETIEKESNYPSELIEWFKNFRDKLCESL